MKFFEIKRSIILACMLFLSFSVYGQKVESDAFKELKFRHIGPVGNRLVAAAGIPGNPMIYYAGAASGGIWKTDDGGVSWKPIFDDKPVHAIGALAVAPSDQQIVWAGTGEPFIRSNVSIGNGVWKSTDGGSNWEHMGLDKTGRISRMLIHPTDPDIVYAAALGHAYLPQKERGIFRSKDGGKTWDHVLMVNDSTGASDLVMHPTNPRILFAGMWQLDIKTWHRESGGKGSGIFMSRDGGDTWKRLEGNGLPKKPVGKIALAMTPANPNRVYALIETGDGIPWHGQETENGELWRSDDLGKTWTMVSQDRDLTGRGAYYTRCAASPDNPNEVYFMAANFSKTIDGGSSIIVPKPTSQPNWDHHEAWIDPTNGNRMIVVGDGGVSISQNRGETWLWSQLPVAQLYHVTVDNQVPYYVYANRQDGPSTKGPSRTFYDGFGQGGIPRGEWYSVGGGESGFATPDPTDPNIVWSSASGFGPGGGIVSRYDDRTRQYRQVEVWPEATFGSPAKDVKYRFQWTFPLLISPHDHNTIYVTSQHVHRTTNGGQSWEEISPDLTTNDKSMQGISGGLTPDNIGVEYGCVIYAFEESSLQKGLFWAGSNDGLVHVSRDNGATWTNVTANIPGLPKLGTVRNIQASKYNAGSAYITIDFHEVGNFDPYVYKTGDFGKTWTKITDGIPKSSLSYARMIKEDPKRQGLLYLGTENALYVSFNDGKNWQSFMNNLPAAPMYWMAVQEHFNDLVLGTYGRGIWILDDITPVHQFTDAIAKEASYLFEPRPAYRFQSTAEPFYSFNDPSAGTNPPPGTPINFWLKEEVKDSIEFVITDESGKVVRKIQTLGKAGFNRIWWNLRSDPSKAVKLRTKPQYGEGFTIGEERSRPTASLMGSGITLLVPPGEYTVTMEANEKKQSQKLKVLKDPNSEGTEADIAQQFASLTAIKEDLNVAADMVNQIEVMRRQVYDLKDLIKDRKDLDTVKTAMDILDKKLIEVEGGILQLAFTGKGQDIIRLPFQTVDKLSYLASTIENADFPPTDQQKQVKTILETRLEESQKQFNQVLETDVPAFLKLLSAKGLDSPILVGKP